MRDTVHSTGSPVRRHDPAEVVIEAARRHSQQQQAAPFAPARMEGQIEALAERSLILHVVIGGQYEHTGQGVVVQAEAEQGQQEPGARAPVPRLHDDVVAGKVRELVLPEAPMLLGHDDHDMLPGNDAARAVERPAEHGFRLPERAVLLRDGSTGLIRRARGKPQSISSRQHDGPGAFPTVHSRCPFPLLSPRVEAAASDTVGDLPLLS
jgi:hypothetical protein